jgi:hypothetical protein
MGRHRQRLHVAVSHMGAVAATPAPALAAAAGRPDRRPVDAARVARLQQQWQESRAHIAEIERELKMANATFAPHGDEGAEALAPMSGVTVLEVTVLEVLWGGCQLCCDPYCRGDHVSRVSRSCVASDRARCRG